MGRALNRARRKLLQLIVSRSLKRPQDGRILVRLGSQYGGWWIPSDLIAPGATVVSGGVGEDTTFDEALLDRGCQVWALDPTPRAAEHVRIRASQGSLDEQFHFLPIGLWSQRQSVRFYAPSNPIHVSHSAVNIQHTSTWFVADCWPLEDVMRTAGFDAPDVLKLDIEGAEFKVVNHMLDGSMRPRAICVEVDAPLPEIRTIRLLRRLRRSGYQLNHVEGWNLLLTYTPPVGH
jgi:FkbM family methyltransferase